MTDISRHEHLSDVLGPKNTVEPKDALGAEDVSTTEDASTADDVSGAEIALGAKDVSAANDAVEPKDEQVVVQTLEKHYETEKKFEFLFNNSNDAIFFHVLGGNFIEVNDRACRNLGYTREEFLRMGPQNIDDPSGSNPQIMQDFMQNGYAVGEVVHRRKDGELLPVELNARRIVINGTDMVLTIARDIRERKKAEEIEKQYKKMLESLYQEAKDSSKKMEVLNKMSRVISSSLDFQEVVKTFAEETYKLFTFDQIVITLRDEQDEELLEKHRIVWGSDQPVEDIPSERIHIKTEPYATVFNSGQPLLNPEHKEMQCMGSCVMIPIKSKDRVEGTFSLNLAKVDKYQEIDLDFLLNLAEHLGIALNNARLHDKVQKMAVVLERNRLAQEIHDSTLQILSYFRAKGELLERMLAKNMIKECADTSKEIQQAALEAYNDTREAIHALSRQSQKGQKFEDIMQAYVSQFSQRWDLRIRLDIQHPLPSSEKGTDLQLLRVVQEALANVRKHSSAGMVQITAQKMGKGYVLEIRDDGVGFDPKKVGNNSFGLKVMRERMNSIGGYLQVLSASGKGSCIRAWVPLQPV